jgi:hypothetical protein
MRITGPLYEGDGFIHRWVASKRVAGALAKSANQAQRDVEPRANADRSGFDFGSMEQAPRQMRAEAIAWFVRNTLERIGRWARRARQRDRDAFLAQSIDLADLERRTRLLERRSAHQLGAR